MPYAGMIGDKWGGMKGKVGKKNGMMQNAIATILFLSENALDQPPTPMPHALCKTTQKESNFHLVLKC